ncbi:HypC/HybG/HupF family hydrogenase formation chaperone [Candidatus Bipolaricaulota bacterium]|jgi:hydrogenase expression/formation protein HypC|nr:HypC/HybG/HupF family hydrogenase formation chaperone [Candidatus Bipolaricaulota bacterium]
MCLAAPAKVISISDNEAVVDYNGVRTTTRLDTLTEPLAPGDYVLIHTGFAIRRLSARDGEETLKLFDELAESLSDSASSSDEANSIQKAELSSLENAAHSPAQDTAETADNRDSE